MGIPLEWNVQYLPLVVSFSIVLVTNMAPFMPFRVILVIV